MVCADYVKHTEATATYRYGLTPFDLTGIIVFWCDGSGFDVLEEPKEQTVYARSLYRLYNKYKKQFAEGKFPSKISFQS